MLSSVSIFAIASPLRLAYLPIPAAALLFLALSLPVILLGVRGLNWLGHTRKWVAISVRISIIWVLVLLLAGAQWVRQNRDLEVILLRDISASTNSVIPPPGKNLSRAIDDLLQSDCRNKRPDDSIGIVSFSRDARIAALPDEHLHLDSHPLEIDTDGTDIASALRLGLASFRRDAMRRLVLISDGNATQGDTDSALTAASAMHVPIDVLPLHYEIRNDVLLDRLIAPTVKQLGEPFSIDVILRSTSVAPVTGILSVTENGQPLDLDPETAGVQSSARITLHAGATSFHFKLPPQSHTGLAQFRATFQADNPRDDTIAGNNTADGFTFINGPAQILYVDGEPASDFGELSRAAGGPLLGALHAQNIDITSQNHIIPANFPAELSNLQSYSAIILANVPLGPGGLSPAQDRNLARYVRDLGGGLIVIGGPHTLGAGNWQGSELEKILPVDCDIPAQRVLPAGALVIVIDHSGSMGDTLSPSSDETKQQLAGESAILAMQTLTRDDLVGVLGFDDRPDWVVNPTANDRLNQSAEKIRAMQPGGGTNICPALEEACRALEKIPPERVGVKRILLLTDGDSEAGDYDALMARLGRANITLSTIAVGSDADRHLLSYLATRAGGEMYPANSSGELHQIFIREARTLRRQLIHEPPGGIDLVQNLDGFAMPKLAGMVLTTLKHDPAIHETISSADEHHDPILATRQAGLGRAAVFTGDATSRWAPQWIASPNFGKFWADIVRDVSRPPTSADFDLQMTRDGSRTHLLIRAMHPDGAARSFLSFAGKIARPDESSADITLQQTGPGVYEANIETPDSGNYAGVIQYHGPHGEGGSLPIGISVPTSVELRDMQSNEAALSEIASRTGGRVLPPIDRASTLSLFDREGLSPSISSHPIDDLLLCIMMGMIVIDVAVRRIHWDWPAIKHWAMLSVAAIQGFTTTRKINAAPTLAALKETRHNTWHGRPALEPIRVQRTVDLACENAVTKISVSKVQSSLGNLKAAKQRAMDEIRQKEKS